MISIHALLAESDPLWRASAASHQYFYPRSPCGERQARTGVFKGSGKFLSTLSLRRATPHQPPQAQTAGHFYPRSPCGERPQHTKRLLQPRNFYPRSPCGERLINGIGAIGSALFLSTLSLRRATNHIQRRGRQRPISIHALLAESDPCRGG